MGFGKAVSFRSVPANRMSSVLSPVRKCQRLVCAPCNRANPSNTSGVSWVGSVVSVTIFNDSGSSGSRSETDLVIRGQTVGHRVKMMFASQGVPFRSLSVIRLPNWFVRANGRTRLMIGSVDIELVLLCLMMGCCVGIRSVRSRRPKRKVTISTIRNPNRAHWIKSLTLDLDEPAIVQPVPA